MVNQTICWAVFCTALVSGQDSQVRPGGPGIDFDLQGFVDQALEARLDPVVIPPGRYRVAPRDRQHLVLRDLNDVRIVAENVEMVCTETTRAITLSNCQEVTLKGLTIDYDPLPYTQGRIVKLSADKKTHDIELFDGYPPADQVQDFKYEIFRPDTRTLRFGSYHQFHAEVLGAKTIRVTRGGSYQGEQLGDIIAIGTKYAPGGQIPHAVYVTDSEGVVLEDVTLYASNCFGFFETRCKRTTYRRCRIDRRGIEDDLKEREDPRIRSLDADAFHSKHAEVGPQILDCTAFFQGDDCVNICGDYHMVMGSEGTRLRVLAKGQLNIQPGDPLEIVTYDGRRLPDARCVTTRRTGVLTAGEQAFLAKQRLHKPFKEGAIREVHEVVIDRDEPMVRGSVIGSANRMGSGFKVRGCDFGFNRSRGILIKASHGEVSNNTLTSCWGEAIKVSPEYWWLESGSSNDVRITGNRISHCLDKGIAVYALAGTGAIAPAGAHSRIVIEDNQISDTKDLAIWVTSTRTLTLKNNRTDRGAACQVKLEQCAAVRTDMD